MFEEALVASGYKKCFYMYVHMKQRVLYVVYSIADLAVLEVKIVHSKQFLTRHFSLG